MSLHDASVGFLRRMDLYFFWDRDGATPVVPIPAGDSGFLLVHIQLDEEAGDALLHVVVYRTPKGRQQAVALRLAELNAARKHVVWSMARGLVRADVCVDLDMARDPEQTLALAFVRLTSAIAEDRDRVIAAGRRSHRRTPSRIDREIEEILSRTEDR